MNLYVRLIWIAVTAFWRSKLGPLELSVIRMRCWPNDLDINVHMNNGRYLSLMDIGRTDLIIRAGLAKVIRQNKWYPVVAAQAISFYRPIGPFRLFSLTTRVSGWDDEWIYLEQEFYVGSKIAARGVLKTVFLSPSGKVTPQSMLEALGVRETSPALPADLKALVEADSAERRERAKSKTLSQAHA